MFAQSWRPPFRWLRTALLAGAIPFVAAATPARAESSLKVELATIADNVSKLLEVRGETTVAVGSFTGPPNFPTSTGPGIVQTLTDEFKKRNIEVKPRAAVGIEGKFHLAEVQPAVGDGDEAGNDDKLLAIRLSGSLVDSLGVVITDFNIDGAIERGEFKADVPGGENVAETLGLPAQLPTNGTPAERDAKIREALANPPSNIIGGSRLAVSAESPYAIEVLVGGVPRPITLDDQLPFVKLEPNETYRIRLINNSDFDAAVRIQIDGLSTFAFTRLKQASGPQQGDPQFDVYIIPKKSSAVVTGWHRTNREVDSFLVTEYARSAAATLNHKTNLGTITASFSAAWPLDGEPPPDERPTAKGEPNATGFGPPIRQETAVTQRNVGAVREVIAVRYAKPE